MKILGIDPGTARVGWGVVIDEDGRIRSNGFGLIRTHKDTLPEKRLEQIYRQVSAIIISEKPDLIAVEKIFFFRNHKTVIEVSQARGIVLLAASINRVEVAEYTPPQVKEAVTGHGRADKKQVLEMVGVMLGLSEAPKIDDTADALAVAICASGCHKFKQAVG
jgi:crossover junction endodeoxyribonuclease RuvC